MLCRRKPDLIKAHSSSGEVSFRTTRLLGLLVPLVGKVELLS